MSLETDIINYGSKAQTRMLELAVVIKDNLKKGIFAVDENVKFKELRQFQEELFSKYNVWTDAQKSEWILYMTERFGLFNIPFIDYDEFVTPIVVPPDTSGDYVTHSELNAAIQNVNNDIDALDVRVTALEDFDYSTLIPQELIDNVTEALDLSHQNSDEIDAINADLDDTQQDLENHINDNDRHLGIGERTTWNNKVSQAQLNDGLDGKANVDHQHEITDVNGLQTALTTLSNEINDINANFPEDGEDGITPNITIGTVETSDTPEVTLGPGSTPEAPVFDFKIPKGEKGDPFEFDAIDTLSNRTSYDTEAEGFIFLASDTGDFYIHGSGDGVWSDPVPFRGDNGWYYDLATFDVSGSKAVLRVIGFSGGTGASPSLPYDPAYIGPTGLTPDVNVATNIRGPQGDTGDQGERFTIDEQGTDRSIWDSQGEGFTFLNTTNGKISFKVSDTVGDWSPEFQWTGTSGGVGPIGPAGVGVQNTINQVGHPFTVDTVAQVKIGDTELSLFDGTGQYVGVVVSVVDADNFVIQSGGYLSRPSTSFADLLYAQNDGSISATVTDTLVMIGIDANKVVLRSAVNTTSTATTDSGIATLNIVAHGFSQYDVLGNTDTGSTPVLYDGANDYVGVVIEVIDVDNIKVQKCGYLDAPFISEGEYYYAQNDGSIGTTQTPLLLIIGCGGTIGAMFDRKMTGFGTLMPGVFYCSPSGNDATAVEGDFTLPYTFAGAVAAASPGDSVSALPGVYNATAGMAKYGVKYTVFGGGAVIVNSTPGLIAFDFDALGSPPAEDISISGFDFELDSAGGAMFKFDDTNPYSNSIIVSWGNARLIDGDYFISAPATQSNSLFSGAVDQESTFDGYFMLAPAGNAGGNGGKIDVRINNNSTTKESFSGTFVNYTLFCNFKGAAKGMTDTINGFQKSYMNAILTQASGCVTFISDNADIFCNGGTLNCSNGSVDLVCINTTVMLGTGSLTLCDGYLENCVITGSYVGKFNSQGCTFEANGNKLTLTGQHLNASMGTAGSLNIVDEFVCSGLFSLAAGHYIIPRGPFRVSGLLVGNINDAILQMFFSDILVDGNFKNTNGGSDAGIIKVATNSALKLALKGPILEAGASSTWSIHAGTGSIAFKLYNKTYTNKATNAGTGAGFSDLIGANATDIVVSTDVSVTA